MADDAQYSVLRQRTGGPRLVSLRREPRVCSFMLHVSGIDQSNQDVYVQKESRHRSSSRSRRTNSEVTRGAPLRSFRSGTPFRVLRVLSEGERARLASEEITSPTDFFSSRAISFAALSTSSSITSVVRIKALITHHTSDAFRMRNIPRVPSATKRLCDRETWRLKIVNSLNRPIAQ